MEEALSIYRRLDAREIIKTVQTLQMRIELRFPGCGLGKVVAELRRVAEETIGRTEWIQKPHYPLRLVAAALTIGMFTIVIALVRHIHQFHMDDYTNFVQALEATIGSMVFLSAAVLFLVSA